MTDVKKLQTLDGMLDYPDPNDAGKGTTEQQFQEYLKNHYAAMYSLVAMALWQPGTNYIVGQVVLSPNMPANTIARVTEAGTSGAAEPVWGSIGSTISDGTVTYIMLPRTIISASMDDIAAGTDKYKAITPAVMAQLLKDIYKQAKLDAHPVGSIYESTSAQSPATLFGGTWEAMDAGRVLVAQGKAETGTTFTAGDIGGEETHKLTTSELPAHSHHYRGTTSTDGAHNHVVYARDEPYGSGDSIDSEGDSWGYNTSAHKTSTNGAHNHTYSGNTDNTGGGASHNNLQPYEVIYRWKRTA